MKIDPSEQFEHLPKAPIVEATIEVRSRVGVPWDEATIAQKTKPQLPDYPNIISLREIQQELKLHLGKPAEGQTRDMGWRGLQFQSGDGRQVVQLHRDAFVFSRLHPYEGWEPFHNEATRLWALYADVAKPAEAQRLGLRFVNRIALPAGDPNFEDYISSAPSPPSGLDLPFLGFLHQDRFTAPGYPYLINTVRVIEPGQDPRSGIGIILDIDVFTAQPFELRDNALELYLAEMRYLKNKVFFGSVTDKALQSFR
jgi:uncharacterized protein (TIGR04255 family)